MYSGSLGFYKGYQLLYKLYQCTIYYCADLENTIMYGLPGDYFGQSYTYI